MAKRLTRNQLETLALLSIRPAEALAGVAVADLAERHGIGRSSTYAALAALQRLGLVTAEWDHSESHPRRLFKITCDGLDAMTTVPQRGVRRTNPALESSS